MLRLWVHSPDTRSEQRFPPSTTLTSLSSRLETITGIPTSQQRVTLQKGLTSSKGAIVPNGEEEEVLSVVGVLDLSLHGERTLESVGAREYTTLKVENKDPHARGLAGQYSDLSRVEKFELTEEEYESRSDTVLAYKQRNKLGRFSVDNNTDKAASTPQYTIPSNLKPGARCLVSLSSELSRRGTVRFVGSVEFGPRDGSPWVGVEWDESVGKGDGEVEGKRYFQTGAKRASFVRPDKVEVGDYPELDPFAEEDEEM